MPTFEITAPDGRKFRVEGPEGSTKEQALAQVQAKYQEPDRAKAAAGGVQSGIAGVLGFPVDSVQSLVNLTPQAVKTMFMAAGRYDLANKVPMIQGAVGGSEWIKRQLKEIGVNFDNPNPNDPASRALHTAGMIAASGGRKPVAPAVAGVTAQETVGPEWVAPATMAPGAVTRSVNAATEGGRVKAQSFNQLRDASLREAQEAGYVVPPSQVRPTFLGNRAESVAGKAALNQEAILRNQAVTDSLARKAIGFPEDVPLTEGALRAHRKELAAPYREVASVSPIAKKALERLEEVRSDAKDHWRHYERQGDPASKREARQLDQQAEVLERAIAREASRAGKPELVEKLREARTNIAKTWEVERALNLGDGHVDAISIARAYDRGVKLSGELQTIAKFASNFRQLARQSAGTPTPGVSGLEPVAMAGLAMGGQASGMGWLPAGIPLAAGPMRSALLSNLYQQRMARPNYAPYATEGDLGYLLRPSVLSNR